MDNLHFIRNVIVKALLLFAAANLLFAWWYPMPQLGQISAYNRLFPGRARLPYADNPDKAYNLSLYNLEAMFASHEIAGRSKPANEYRVIVIGDSSTWGWLLPVKDTLTTQLNSMHLQAPDGRKMRFYNLGYPVMSLTKDLVILSYGMRYQPDLVIWPLTLESFPKDKQLYPPLLQNNPQVVKNLIERYHLEIPTGPGNPAIRSQPGWLERTLIGARRPLADLLRLQLYGVMWSTTGIDQEIPVSYPPLQKDFKPDPSFHELQPPRLDSHDLAFDVIQAALSEAGDTPVLMINEPMFISTGENSDIRYNFYYPRWAYDQYRQLIAEHSAILGWQYRDYWDSIPPAEFTNSAVHLSPAGSRLLAEKVAQAIQEMFAQTGKPK
jgi:hypothetical protein